jgi:hypothetical protein
MYEYIAVQCTGESHLDLLHRSQVLSPLLVHCLRSEYSPKVVMNSIGTGGAASYPATAYSSSTDVCSGAAKALGNLSRRGHPGMINGEFPRNLIAEISC